MSHKTALSIVIILLMVTLPCSVEADSWRLPEKQKYDSPNKRYYLEVTPKKLESQLSYFQDKVVGKERASALKEAKNNHAKGQFCVRSTFGGCSLKWNFPLVNEVAPVSAIVSNNGDYFVTFDNWHGVGYGNDVVVIYKSDGSLIKKFGLNDILTDGDIEVLPHSVSSIWWGGKHYIDEATGNLILKVVSNGQDTWTGKAEFLELKIELATGHLLQPKRDLLPQPRYTVEAGPALNALDVPAGNPICNSTEESFDSPDVARIPVEEFFAKVKERPLPQISPIAKAARAAGRVVVEVLVSKEGNVICARLISGHPLLRAVVMEAVLKWKFEPFEIAGSRAKATGKVALDFKAP